MTTAATLIGRARVTLIDSAKVTFTDDELLAYLNEGIAHACGVLLDIYVKAEVATLAAGVRQNLPAGGLLLLDIPRNSTGETVTQAALAELSRTHPNWAAETGAGVVNYFMFDRRTPATFLVYPPATVSAAVELVYGAIPTEVVLGDEIPVSRAFDTALWAYVIGLAYAKNTKTQDLQKSQGYLGLFNQILSDWKKAKESTALPPDLKGVH